MTGLNWIDAILVVVIVVFALVATTRGFVQVLASLLGFVVTLAAALAFHPTLANFFESNTGLPPIWCAPLAFVAIWIASQLIFWLLVRLLLGNVIYRLSRSPVDRFLAVLPGAIHGVLVTSLFITFLALLPFPGVPREAIMDSSLGGQMVRATMAFEQPLERVFGAALKEAVGFLTVRPEPGAEDAYELNFSVANPTPDAAAEERMLALVNAERTQRGLQPLAMDESLRRLARAYAADMFQRSYFSHVGRDGRDPFARMRDAGITYSAAGENLALSPTTEIAHEGLMASPGHRANILNPLFRKVGIGVMDGGVHGKMFVQEFTD